MKEHIAKHRGWHVFFSAATVENLVDPKKSAAYDRKRLLNTFVSCVVVFVLACAANAFSGGFGPGT